MTETHAARSGGRDLVRDGLDERRPPRWTSLAAWAGIVGPILFTATFLAQEALPQRRVQPHRRDGQRAGGRAERMGPAAELRRLRAADDRLRDRAAPRRTAEQGGHRRARHCWRSAGSGCCSPRSSRCGRTPPASPTTRAATSSPGSCSSWPVPPGWSCCPGGWPAIRGGGASRPTSCRPGSSPAPGSWPWARSSCRTMPRCTPGPAWGSDCSSSSSCSPAGSSCPSGCCAQRASGNAENGPATSPGTGDMSGPADPRLPRWVSPRSCCVHSAGGPGCDLEPIGELGRCRPNRDEQRAAGAPRASAPAAGRRPRPGLGGAVSPRRAAASRACWPDLGRRPCRPRSRSTRRARRRPAGPGCTAIRPGRRREEQPRRLLVIDHRHPLSRTSWRRLGRARPTSDRSTTVVVATRVDPPLPVGRLAIAGELAEIRAKDLRWTGSEVRGAARGTPGSEPRPRRRSTCSGPHRGLVGRAAGWPSPG